MRHAQLNGTLDALAYIVKSVRDGWNSPHVDSEKLVPGLSHCFGSTAWDKHKRIIERIDYEYFQVGWYDAEQLIDGYEIEVLGTSIFVHGETLQRLSGCRLVLKTVDSAWAREEGRERQVLVAVRLQD
jgi:hypothetical protein